MIINVPRAQRVLSEKGLDGLLAATNIPNVFYLSGVWRQGDLAAAAPLKGLDRPWVAIPRSEVDYLEDSPVRPAGVATYGTFYRELDETAALTGREERIKALGIDLEPVGSFLEGVVSILASAGLGKGTVGYDERGLDPALVNSFLQQEAKVVSRSVRQYGSVRLSLHAFNTEADIDLAAETVERALREGIPDDVEPAMPPQLSGGQGP